MPRIRASLASIIGGDFDLLLKLVNNLLVNNKNFESGYYARTCPSTGQFIRTVLPSFAEGISQRVEALKEVVVANLEDETWTAERVDQLRAEFEQRVYGRYLHTEIKRASGNDPVVSPPVEVLAERSLFARISTGDYLDPAMDVAWWAYRAALDVPTVPAPVKEAA